jgi:hypothetical protein
MSLSHASRALLERMRPIIARATEDEICRAIKSNGPSVLRLARSTERLVQQSRNQVIKFSRDLNLTCQNTAGFLLKLVEPELRIQ